MIQHDLRLNIKAQLTNLESLLAYLEDREQLGAKEYLFCQAKINETVKQLKRLERFTEQQRNGSGA